MCPSKEMLPRDKTTSNNNKWRKGNFRYAILTLLNFLSIYCFWFEESTNYDQLKVRLMKYQKLPRITLLYLAFVFAACQCLCLCPLAWSENVRIEIFSNSVQFSSPPLQMQFQQQKSSLLRPKGHIVGAIFQALICQLLIIWYIAGFHRILSSSWWAVSAP